MSRTRHQITATRLGELIRQAGGNVTSLVPPTPGEHIQFECIGAIAEKLPQALRDLGYQVNKRGLVQRLVPHASNLTYTMRTYH